MTIAATQFPARPMRSSADISSTDAPSDVSNIDVSWRPLSSGLWAARRDGRHLGTVQRGRRWLASDADSEPIGSFRTFEEARAAVMGPVPRGPEARGAAAGGPLLLAAGLLAAALTSAAVWTSAALLL